MKKTFAKIVTAALGRQVRRLRKKHAFKVVAVVGDNSTPVASILTRILNESLRVRYSPGGSEDYEVLMQFFGQKAPHIFNIFGWMRMYFANAKQTARLFRYEVVVLECPQGLAGLQEFVAIDIAIVPAEKTIQKPGERISYEVKSAEANYHLANIFSVPGGYEADIKHEGEIYLHVSLKAESEAAMITPLAAIIAARELDCKTPQIQAGLAALWRPVKEVA